MKRPENHFYIDKFGGKGFSIPTRWKSRNPPPPVLAPPHDNPNSNDQPTLIDITTIATQVSPGLWIMNGDVTIASNEQLGLIEGSTVVTTHEFTNNGIFINGIGATFITSSTFTNNGKFTNNGGFTVNLSSGQLVFNRSDDRNKIIENKGSVIVNFGGTYTGRGIILGNPVQSAATMVDLSSLVNAMLKVFTKP